MPHQAHEGTPTPHLIQLTQVGLERLQSPLVDAVDVHARGEEVIEEEVLGRPPLQNVVEDGPVEDVDLGEARVGGAGAQRRLVEPISARPLVQTIAGGWTAPTPVEEGTIIPVPAVDEGTVTLVSAVEEGTATLVSAVEEGTAMPVSAVEEGTIMPVSVVEEGAATVVSAVDEGTIMPVSAVEEGTATLVSAVEEGTATVVSAVEKTTGIPVSAVEGSTGMLVSAVEKGTALPESAVEEDRRMGGVMAVSAAPVEEEELKSSTVSSPSSEVR